VPLHDNRYQHWDGVHLGLWSRRLVIAQNGLAACLRNRWLRYLVVLCWASTLGMTALLFLMGQLLVADSAVVRWVGNFNPGLQSFARMLTSWLEQHPEISVRATQNLLFHYFCIFQLRAAIFAIGMAIPVLITRDLASNAIIIYSSKAVSRADYLLGKFATAFGLLALTWLGPACAAWFLGNLLAPDWRFFWHSRAVLGHILMFGLSSLTLLSLLAMGVSACASKEKSTVGLWYTWWIVGGVVAPIALHTRPWLQHLSFNYNLEQVALGVFRLGADLNTARENIPVFGEMLNHIPARTMETLNHPALAGAAGWSLAMIALALWVLNRRVRPE
jgi:ABC-2 type transport system permease protein